jgi:hypothetical protein
MCTPPRRLPFAKGPGPPLVGFGHYRHFWPPTKGELGWAKGQGPPNSRPPRYKTASPVPIIPYNALRKTGTVDRVYYKASRMSSWIIQMIDKKKSSLTRNLIIYIRRGDTAKPALLLVSPPTPPERPFIFTGCPIHVYQVVNDVSGLPDELQPCMHRS